MAPLRIGMIGLDTSHVTAFADLLHDARHAHHVPGARVVAAFPGGSPDFELSIGRVDGFTRELREKHAVTIAPEIAALRADCDAIMLESVDGRVHRDQFCDIADWGVPVFIDKPLAVSSADARAIATLATQRNVRVLSSSALRFAEPLRAALVTSPGTNGPITGADLFGPMQLQEKSPGFFFYGIHTVEMLYAAFGPGCREVKAYRSGDFDVIVATWRDGRVGTVRGNRMGNTSFGGMIHRARRSVPFDVSAAAKPFYASLLDEVIRFFHGAPAPVPLAESVEIIRFIEAANESLAAGRTAPL